MNRILTESEDGLEYLPETLRKMGRPQGEIELAKIRRQSLLLKLADQMGAKSLDEVLSHYNGLLDPSK